MADAICRGAIEKISEDVNKKGRAGHIESFNLQEILKKIGMIPDMDANRIVVNLEHEAKVELTKFHQFVQRSTQYAKDRSQPLKKFVSGAQKHGKAIVQRFETQDHNKDGQLNVDGFKAALLI